MICIACLHVGAEVSAIKISPARYISVSDGDSLVLVSDESSEVIALGLDTFSFGSTEKHYAFAGMSPFFYNQELFSIGGYGYWRVNPFLLKFKKDSGWEAIQLDTKYKPVVPRGTVIMDSILHVIGGRNLVEGSLTKFENYPFIQSINLETKELIGLSKLDILTDFSVKWFIQGSYILFLGENRVTLFNTIEEEEFSFPVEPDNFEIVRDFLGFDVVGNRLIINEIFEFDLSENTGLSCVWPFLSVSVVVIGVILIRIFQKKRKGIDDTTLKSINFNVLGLLLALRDKTELRHVELLDFCNPNLSQSHQNRIIRDGLETLNKEFQERYDYNCPLVFRRKDVNDLRSFVYGISDEISVKDLDAFFKFIQNDASNLD